MSVRSVHARALAHGSNRHQVIASGKNYQRRENDKVVGECISETWRPAAGPEYGGVIIPYSGECPKCNDGVAWHEALAGLMPVRACTCTACGFKFMSYPETDEGD